MNNIFSKIRKNGLMLLALSVGGVSTGMLTSCGDFLEVEPQNEITLDKFWNEKSDVEAIIAGCYSQMQSNAVLSRMVIWGEYRSENVVWSGTNADDDINLNRLMKENITASNAYTTYGDFYSVINRCNTVIKYAPQVAAVDPSYTQSQLKAHIAEVTALRSLCYFYLIRTFRDVPYTEEAYLDDSEELALPATSFDDVLSKLIASLESVKDDAISNYSDDGGTYSAYYNTGRITKWAIYAMLCDMYLWQKDYNNCIKYANLIIEHKISEAKNDATWKTYDFSNYNNYPLIGTKMVGFSNYYGNDFNWNFVEGNSIESIFELNFIKNSEGNQNSNEPFSNFYGGQGRTPWVTASDYIGHDEMDGIYNVFDAQNKGFDARAYEYLHYSSEMPDYVNKTTTKSGIELYCTSSGSNILKLTSWGSQYETYGTNHVSRNKANFIFYRLSDIMLLAAEAYSQLIVDESDKLTSESDIEYRNRAFNLVNAVNKRSLMQQEPKDTLVLSKYASKADITDLVYEERERELMFEGKRYFDLVRRSRRDGNTDYLAEHCQNKSTDLKTIIKSKMQKMDAIYWPYNLDEMKVNPYLIQNSAFGSGENSSYKENY